MKRVVMSYRDARMFLRSTRPEDHHEDCAWRSWRRGKNETICDCNVLWDEYDRRKTAPDAEDRS